MSYKCVCENDYKNHSRDKYSSVQTCTRNANGKKEIRLELYNGLFRYLFKMPRRIEVYESDDGIDWFVPGTFHRPSIFKEYELQSIYHFMMAQK